MSLVSKLSLLSVGGQKFLPAVATGVSTIFAGRLRKASNAKSQQNRSMLHLRDAEWTDVEIVREKMRKFGGGEIILDLPEPHDDDAIATLTIKNPAHKNALTGNMMAQLSDAVDTLANWKGTCLIVQGADNCFCSGADLSVAYEHLTSPQSGMDMCLLMSHTLNRLRHLPLISIAAIEGYAMGGGAEVTTACDFRVVAENAKIHFVQVKMGISPAWAGGSRLTKLVGRQNALKVLAGAIPLVGQECMAYGLADKIAPQGQAFEVAKSWAQTFCAHTPDASRAIKMVVSAADDLPLENAVYYERKIFSTVWGTPSNIKAIANSGRTGRRRKSVPAQVLPSTEPIATVPVKQKSTAVEGVQQQGLPVNTLPPHFQTSILPDQTTPQRSALAAAAAVASTATATVRTSPSLMS